MIQIESATANRPGLVALEPSDGDKVARLFGRLSAESLYRRFFSPIGGEIVGVAQYARSKGRSEADLAIVVADAWQRQGIGTRLVAALADRAMSQGITAFAVDVQGDNHASIRLLRRVAPGIRLAFSEGVGEGSFPLSASEVS